MSDTFGITQAMINDALRFMRVPGEGRTFELQDEVRRTFLELEKIIQPRVVWSRWPVSVTQVSSNKYQVASDGVAKYNYIGIRVGGDGAEGFEIRSADLARLMANSRECYLMAVTIGAEVDRKILLAQTRSMFDGMMLDSCASVRADALCDQAEREIFVDINREHVHDHEKALTTRFSPGYGDAPLEASRDIIAALDATRKIGLSMTRSFMMTPVKSITALIGVIERADLVSCNDNNNDNKGRGACAICHARARCLYKMKGEYCGK